MFEKITSDFEPFEPIEPINDSTRKLSTVQEIATINSIEGADRIVVVTM